jgi:NADH dehydrogenase [ubiquinone] 1 alpha subcomplex assembly factor 7
MASSPGRSLAAHLRTLVELRGPLSLATYMREALTHPQWGYYTRRGDDAHNGDGGILSTPLRRGDFVTSPQLS